MVNPDRIKSIAAMIAFVLLAALACMTPLAAEDIYETVDEHGNTVYTDQKPSEDAVPIELKALTVVDPVDLGDEQAIAARDEAGAAQRDMAPASDASLRIVSPAPDETIWNTAYVLSVQVDVEGELPPDSRLAYLVDGEVRTTTESPSVEIEQVFRGEHTLSVELRASDGRVLARDGPVTFYMRQHSRLHPNPG